MALEMTIPSPGESITEVEIANWLVADGDYVEKDQVLAEIDSDKATLELNAEAAGKVKILVEAGSTVKVGDKVCTIDTSAKAPEGQKAKAEPKKEEAKQETAAAAKTAEPAKSEAAPVQSSSNYATGLPSVAAKKMMDENGMSSGSVQGTGKNGRVTKGDVLSALANGTGAAAPGWGGREIERQKLSSLRRKLSQRLVAVKNETAMLTTFNEVDMSRLMSLRKKYKDAFEKTHGVKLGFMSFFTKAVTEALKNYPNVNAMIDGEEIVHHRYADVGIAVSTPKGLMVPVLRNAEQMSLADIERNIGILAVKARDGKITIDEMTGGTFTITNGGVFGSMLSTPIINPPQSGILGMHNIVERPVAVNGQVEIRPIMYVALSYDHRIIDGKDSVGFLVNVKQMLEDPIRMLTGGKDADELLLNL
ncbi:MAG: 2-oxoglutarate dehydrogenase complex dihydrolipoyllysine-residue succinyltransferase [Flavobacteriales bacterium]|nr:2-oxoglutarate dehydrogenase complex dihydrolipoyllysine-residue succinyltransferase [Flavobacteriales bacterium]MCB9449272.1 2-oxoglutarate dehydrogenase complex dihydrolipoyllysine-residue succinyltransferase [Flavobacteriales bacterium]